MKVTELCKKAFETAKNNGFHEKPVHIPESLALIHSEVSEALEADRKGDSENFAEELADVCIRVFDLCGALGIDLETEIADKMAKNAQREYKHGKLY